MADQLSKDNAASDAIDNDHNLKVVDSAQKGEKDGQAAHMDPEHRKQVEKSLKRKLDSRCSLFVLIYIMNYLDRNNIAAARLGGLQEDLNINNTQYATCLSILYVGYILMQVPSNILINRISRPSLYISVAMLLWGLISTLSGNTHNFAGMVAVRFFIGFVEAAFLPGALLILSKWYTRRELTTRNAILFCGNLISNAFSSLVGAGVLSNMEGTLGHRAWRWLYWIEGAVTMLIAISASFILPDLPHNSRGFTQEEREVAVLRMTEDVGEADADSAEQSPFAGLVMAVKDVKIYVMMLTFTAYVVGLSFNAFFPTLTATLGFSYVPTLLMSAPPWAFSCIVSLINAWHADHTQERFWHIVCPIFGGLIGFIISMCTLNVAARYVALFLQASAYAGFIVFYSWISSSFPRPPAKRAVAIALINAFSQLGNIAGSYVWNLPDNGFRKSYGIVTAMFGVTIVGCYVFKMILVRLNERIEKGETTWDTKDDVAVQTAKTEGVSVQEGTELQKGFRYLV
ncbi:MFS general substrate transporter [Zopfia rhizophila CBS 207.26]|uniref:MFS general substrate transporter n=1 Tax=Zopfia rhizophila CBS 207.26 TaxID=1314779 RepID=A0A6A6D7F2_9PEZI|nr:MFS general substrate transporter [Zopfia rhizophila CBS 207.26]